MKIQKQNLFWGGMLILFGVLALVDNLIDLSVWVWVGILALAGVGVLGLYAIDRSEKWPLIAAYVLFDIAFFLALITIEFLRDEAIPAYVMGSIALPFLVAYILDRTQWPFLIPAYVLTAIGLMIWMIGLGILTDLLIPAYVLFAIALPFLVVYVRNRRHWWALIPGGILSAIALSFLIAEAAVQYVVPIALILAGVWILFRQFRPTEA